MRYAPNVRVKSLLTHEGCRVGLTAVCVDGGKEYVAESVNWTLPTLADRESVEPLLELSVFAAQALMNSLWQQGVRPSHGTTGESRAATIRKLKRILKKALSEVESS